jgi:hypothetical protein
MEGEFYSGIVELTQEILLSIWLQDGRITGNNPFRNLKLRCVDPWRRYHVTSNNNQFNKKCMTTL